MPTLSYLPNSLRPHFLDLFTVFFLKLYCANSIQMRRDMLYRIPALAKMVLRRNCRSEPRNRNRLKVGASAYRRINLAKKGKCLQLLSKATAAHSTIVNPRHSNSPDGYSRFRMALLDSSPSKTRQALLQHLLSESATLANATKMAYFHPTPLTTVVGKLPANLPPLVQVR